MSTTKPGEFKMVRVTLSDGSIAFNVEGVVDGYHVAIGCTDSINANLTVDVLNAAAWIEVEGAR